MPEKPDVWDGVALPFGEPDFLPAKWDSLENKVEDTQDMQGQSLALLTPWSVQIFLKKKKNSLSLG